MPATYEPIATTTTTGNVTDVTLSSIPATYTDLKLVITGSGATASTPVFYFNLDTSTLYSVTRMTANTTDVITSRSTGQTKIVPNDVTLETEPRKHLFVLDIFNYAGSTFKTTLLSCTRVPTTTSNSRLEKMVGLYRSTSAITSITMSTFSGTDLIRAGSTYTLFGIKAA
jgi:hypothetical protein